MNFDFITFSRKIAQEELNAADDEKIAGIVIISFISLVTIIFYFFVKNALDVIRIFAKEVMDKVIELGNYVLRQGSRRSSQRQ